MADFLVELTKPEVNAQVQVRRFEDWAGAKKEEMGRMNEEGKRKLGKEVDLSLQAVDLYQGRSQEEMSAVAGQYQKEAERYVGEIDGARFLTEAVAEVRSMEEIQKAGVMNLGELIVVIRVVEAMGRGKTDEEIQSELEGLVNTNSERNGEFHLDVIEEMLRVRAEEGKRKGETPPEVDNNEPKRGNYKAIGLEERWWRGQNPMVNEEAAVKMEEQIRARAREIVDRIPGMEVCIPDLDKITLDWARRPETKTDLGIGAVCTNDDGKVEAVWFDPSELMMMSKEDVDKIILHELMHVRSDVTGKREITHSGDSWNEYVWEERLRLASSRLRTGK